jgi:site-specific recombinase XerD
MTVSEAFEPFINSCRAERDVAASSIAKYRDCFQVWISPWLGDRDLTEVNRIDVLEMRKAMLDHQLSTARQYSIIMCLKSLLKFCRVTLGISCLDPAEIKLPKRAAPQVEYLSNDEIQRVLDGININTFAGIRLRSLIELLLATGMRISEALSLKRELFDAGRTETEIVGKGKRRRAVFFPSRARYWIRQYLDRRVDEDPSLFVTTGFPVRTFRREDVSRFFADLRRKVGLTKKFSPHILRHTFCTNLRNNGADITFIKDLAGHQNIQTTARYYLGKDKAVLRDIVDRCLNYGLDSPGNPAARPLAP